MMRAADPLKRLVPQVVAVYFPPDRSSLQPTERHIGEQFGEYRQQRNHHIARHTSSVALPGQSLSGRPILPPSKDGPVEVSKDRSLFHGAMLLDGTEPPDEGMTRLGLRGHRQHALVESVHQAVHLTQQQRADATTPRTCPNAAACPEKPGIIFLVWCAGPAK